MKVLSKVQRELLMSHYKQLQPNPETNPVELRKRVRNIGTKTEKYGYDGTGYAAPKCKGVKTDGTKCKNKTVKYARACRVHCTQLEPVETVHKKKRKKTRVAKSSSKKTQRIRHPVPEEGVMTDDDWAKHRQKMNKKLEKDLHAFGMNDIPDYAQKMTIHAVNEDFDRRNSYRR